MNSPWRIAKLILITSTLSVSMIIFDPSWAKSQKSKITSEPASKRRKLDQVPSDYMMDMIRFRRTVETGFKDISTSAPGLRWKKGDTVKVAFYGGNEDAYRFVEATVAEWKIADLGITFSFLDDDGHFRKWDPADTTSDATIRISFYQSGPYAGYWSSLGRMALVKESNLPTMNLDDIADIGAMPPALRQTSYAHSVVLHEFGHALGLAHEQFHPDCQADLKMDDAVAYLAKENGWDEQNAAFQIDASIYETITLSRIETSGLGDGNRNILKFSPHIDPKSTMLYNLPPAVLKSGAKSPCISRGDMHFEDGTAYASHLSSLDLKAATDLYAEIKPGTKPSEKPDIKHPNG